MSHRHIAILGNGVAGITAARHIRKNSEDRITVISGETEHHFSRTALMYIYMGDLTYEDTKPYEDGFWPKNRIALRRDWVESIDTAANRLVFQKGEPLDYDELIVATGSSPNKFGWPGQDLVGVQGLYSIQDVETMEKLSATTKHVAIVGGGLIGVEVAEMLLTRGIGVTFLVREKNFWGNVLPEGEAKLVEREIRSHGVDMRVLSELKAILDDDQGRARAIVTKEGEEIPCQMVFLTAGVSPNIGVARASGIECERGVLVDPFFRTSVSNIWSIGDCAQHRVVPPGRRPVEQTWYTSRIHGEHLADNLCGQSRPYQPGIWFNSAKFFEIEYQTYGLVPAKSDPAQRSFFWENPEGTKSLRLNFEAESRRIVGVNVFGIRHRHAVWEQWISAGALVSECVAHLGAANFDPEFFRQYEQEIVSAFNSAFPEMAVKLQTRKGLFSLSRLFGQSKRQFVKS